MNAEIATLDKRLNAFRSDLADESLRGMVAAERFVQGKPMRVADPVVDVRAEPRGDAGIITQLLYGDDVLVFEDDNGWCWVQNERDGYVGYVVDTTLDRRSQRPDAYRHRSKDIRLSGLRSEISSDQGVVDGVAGHGRWR